MKLTKVEREALDAVEDMPGSTAREIAFLRCTFDTRHLPRRLRKLVRMGLVEVGKKRTCTVSGYRARIWWPRNKKTKADPTIGFMVTIPVTMKEAIREHKRVNWNAVAEQAFERILAELA